MPQIQLKCEACGKVYSRWPCAAHNSRFCSRSCQGKRPSQNKTGHLRPCYYCGSSFYASNCYDKNKKRTAERPFCSRTCFVAYNKIEMFCEQCNKQFYVQRHRKDIARFCGYPCYNQWLSSNNVGEAHPAWKGGWEPYYGTDWSRQRLACRQRDNHTCRICSVTVEQVGSKNIDVHHVLPFRLSRDNSLGNLVTLCDGCHHSVEAGKLVCPNP